MFVRQVVITTAISILLTVSVFAQNNSCPALVETALTKVGEACAGLGRNQACYGNGDIIALDFDSALITGFKDSGDRADVMNISTLATAPMNVEDNIWGVALLALQADLPNTFSGQSVTFVIFGDTELTNEVTPEDQAEPPPTLSATATSGINVRSGPGTGFGIVSSLALDDVVTLTGRNEAGDWAQISLDGQTAWVYTPLLKIEADMMMLWIVETGADTASRFTAPMQAFSLTGPIGVPTCEEAPKDGVLIQAPTDTSVHFLINGIEVEIGSTTLLQLEDEVLGVNTFDGSVKVTSSGETQTAEPGQRVDVIEGQAPAEPVAYDIEDVTGAPVDLLPEAVDIPPPDGTQIGIVRCALAQGGQATAPSGHPIVINFGWAAATSEQVNDFANGASIELEVNGEAMPPWTSVGPNYRDNADSPYLTRWYWVIPDPVAGQYQLTSSVQLAYAVSDGDTISGPGQLDPFSCIVTVQ